MSVPSAESLPIAVRAYAPRPPVKTKNRNKKYRSLPRVLPPSDYSLVFDCETWSDRAQHLRLGAFQVRKAGEIIRAGLFYEPDGVSESDLRAMVDFVAVEGLELMTRAEWVEDVFFRYVADLGGVCVGFNLPFDLSRIAIGHVRGRGANRNAFSFELSPEKGRDRVRVQHRSANAARIQFAPRHRRRITDHPGHFLDVKTVARALTGSSHSLASLSNHLSTEHRKEPSGEHGGALRPSYLAYAMNDVQVTRECYEVLAGRYESFGLDAPITSVMSEASIGKASLEQMGIRPFRNTQPDYAKERLGRTISSYYGGRSEVRLRKQIAEVAHCDFKSMYPTVCGLQHLWRFVTAEGIDHTDITGQIRDFLDRIELEDLRDPQRWPELVVLVEVAPDADFFPVRAQFGAAEQYGLAQSYLSSSTGETLWFTLADCCASKLRTGKPPTILRAVRCEPRAPQQGLSPLAIAGNPDYTVDPYADDFYIRLIDLRTQIKRQARAAEQAGDIALAARLDGEQQALKITANATSYGIFIELNPHELDDPANTTAYGLDGRRFTTRVRRHEQPGRFFNPLLATLITGAARLMLTLAEVIAAKQGLDWAQCDTDSLVLVRPTGMTRPEFHAAVECVQAWFRQLSPYAGEGELFELEITNYKLNREPAAPSREPLYVYAISPKRYVLFNIDTHGRPVIRKGSAHGLGHLLNPYGDRDAPIEIPTPVQPLHKLELYRWQYDLWYRIIEAALDDRPVDLADLLNFDRPAMAQCSITTPTILTWFRHHNRGKPYAQKIRPFGFLITPSVRSFDKPLGKAGESFHLIAPYAHDPATWNALEYLDIYSGEPFNVSTSEYDRETARVQSYADHARRYVNHPDPKRLGPDRKPCRRETLGLLSPRHIDAFHIEQLGKEANRLEEVEAGITHQKDEVYTGYQDPQRDPWRNLVLPVLRAAPRPQLLQTNILRRSALREVLAGRARPRPDKQRRLTQLAVAFARQDLETRGIRTAGHSLAILHAYNQQRTRQNLARRCPTCGTVINNPRKTYCSDACRQSAYRQRAETALKTPV